MGEIFLDVQRHLRGHTVQLGDQVRKEVGTDGVDRAYLERGGQLVLAGLGQFADALSLFEHFLSLGHDAFANRREAHRALAAFEDQYAELILELLHTHREGRLAHMATLGRMAEVLFLGECDDVTEFCEGHNVRP